MKENFEDYEEFYISDDPQDIERERKKRNSLLSMFPLLTGGGKDRTKYVISNDSTANSGSGQQLNMQKSTEQKIPGAMDGAVTLSKASKPPAMHSSSCHKAPTNTGHHSLTAITRQRQQQFPIPPPQAQEKSTTGKRKTTPFRNCVTHSPLQQEATRHIAL